MQLEKLVGRTVLQVLTNPERDEFRFVTDEGNLDYYCYGDCCSESWVNHIADIDLLIGQKVLEIEEFDMFKMLNVEPEATRQDVDEVLFHRIQTPKGVCVIEFRNSSNGYYGGSFEEGLHKGEDMQPITEDF
jgi:hypothetical protein